jgi:hypothetical protein
VAFESVLIGARERPDTKATQQKDQARRQSGDQPEQKSIKNCHGPGLKQTSSVGHLSALTEIESLGSQFAADQLRVTEYRYGQVSDA